MLNQVEATVRQVAGVCLCCLPLFVTDYGKFFALICCLASIVTHMVADMTASTPQTAASDRKTPQLLTIPEVMQRLGLRSRQTVYKLIDHGDLPVVDISPTGSKATRHRVSVDDLAAYISARTHKAGRK